MISDDLPLRKGVELGIIKHFEGRPYLNELQKEAMMHNFGITDKVLRIEFKEQIKKRLGVSPDLFDTVIMALNVALRPVQPFPSNDEDYESPSAPSTSGLGGPAFSFSPAAGALDFIHGGFFGFVSY